MSLLKLSTKPTTYHISDMHVLERIVEVPNPSIRIWWTKNMEIPKLVCHIIFHWPDEELYCL